MSRARLRVVVLSSCVLGVAASAPGAGAQESSNPADAVLEQMASDISVLAVNTPIWLAQHLPATMPQSGLGAGIDLEGGGSGFSLGIVPLRLGLFNQFSQVGRGTEMLDFESLMPGNLPWIQFGVAAGFALGKGFELGFDVHGVPRSLFEAGDTVSAKVQLISASTAIRWRLNDSKYGLPAVILGVGGSFYLGDLEIGAGYSDTYTLTEDTPIGPQDIKGTYSFSGAPLMKWSLFQVAPEVRLAWKLAILRPYVGLGLGMTWGEVSGGAKLEAEITVDEVAGQPQEDKRVYTERSTLYTTAPARYTFRPHVGMDLVLGIVAITAQLDLAVMSQDKVSGDVGGAAENFDPDAEGGLLYNEASKESQTASALVGTLALRLQF